MTCRCGRRRFKTLGTVRLTHDVVRYLIAIRLGVFDIVHVAQALKYGLPVRGGQA